MIYLDCHATTPLDPRVLAAMLPWMTANFGNPHSHTHGPGRMAALACDDSLSIMAAKLDCRADSIIVTSGATESNNLAIDGVMRHPRNRRRHFITVATEHPSVLDPAARLVREGFRVTVLPVRIQGDPECGQVDLDALRDVITDDTALVSIMWANNEIGTLQPIAKIAEIVHAAGALFHCDASQAIGRIPTPINQTDIDLLSGSAHKFYGPKGVGFLALANRRRIRLRPLFEGGGQQQGLRSGTMNPAAVVGMCEALRYCDQSISAEQERQTALRDSLWNAIQDRFPDVVLNGPPLVNGDGTSCRLGNNLNFSLVDVEGETLMAAMPELAISSGSACSSVDPRPSHVLTAIGISESRARRSLRFGLGTFTSAAEVAAAASLIAAAHRKVCGEQAAR